MWSGFVSVWTSSVPLTRATSQVSSSTSFGEAAVYSAGWKLPCNFITAAIRECFWVDQCSICPSRENNDLGTTEFKDSQQLLPNWCLVVIWTGEASKKASVLLKLNHLLNHIYLCNFRTALPWMQLAFANRFTQVCFVCLYAHRYELFKELLSNQILQSNSADRDRDIVLLSLTWLIQWHSCRL